MDFLPKSISVYNLLALKSKIEFYIKSKGYPIYTSGVNEIFSEAIDLISEELIDFMKSILEAEMISLENIELHYMPPFSQSIPPHQDNFYHCIDGEKE